MYSGMSPSLSTKFWKKELVGSGAARSAGAKKQDGSGTTVDVAAVVRHGGKLEGKKVRRDR